MFKEILEGVSGLTNWAIIAMLIFFVTFAIVIIKAIRMDKSHVKRMANLPLDSETSPKKGDL